MATVITFTPPTVEQGPMSWGHRLFQFYEIDHGVTVIKKQDGTFTQGQYFSNLDPAYANAQAIYVGGNIYTISDAEATALDTAGYGAYLTFTPTGFGYGPFGVGPFGG